jgi:hypothetical protein
MVMRTVADPGPGLSWLESRAADPEAVTGYDAVGWEASAWILHAMYEHPGLPGDVTHDDLHRSCLARGLDEPTVIGGVNLDDVSASTGIPLGFEQAPGPPWRRLRWSEYARRPADVTGGARLVLPPERWIPSASGLWPASIRPPTEGSLDEVSLHTLMRVLAAQTADGQDADCFAFRHPAMTRDYRPLLLSGPLRAVCGLIEDEEALQSAPNNFWPRDRSWFAWTDWDACGTKVSGLRGLIDAILAEADLEAVARENTDDEAPAADTFEINPIDGTTQVQAWLPRSGVTIQPGPARARHR